MEAHAWVVHRKPHHIECMKVFLAKNIVAIGWPELDFSGMSESEVEEELKQYSTTRNATKDRNVVWAFVGEMQRDDLVLVPEGPNIHVAVVTGTYTHQSANSKAKLPYRNQRRVRWMVGSPFPKRVFPAEAQRKSKAQSPPVLLLETTPAEIRRRLGSQVPQKWKHQPKPIQKVLRARPVGLKDETEGMAYRKAAEIKIRTIHNALINDFNAFIKERVDANESTYDLFIDKGWLPGRTLLIEAKSNARNGAGRHQVREAIGQLFDYRMMLKKDGFKNIDLAILTPQKPDRELLELAHQELGIEVIWRARKGFRGSRGVDAWLRSK